MGGLQPDKSDPHGSRKGLAITNSYFTAPVRFGCRGLLVRNFKQLKMRKVIYTTPTDTIGVNEVQSHCFLGVVSEGKKYFAAQVGNGKFMLFNPHGGYINRRDEKQFTMNELLFHFRNNCVVADDFEDLYEWIQS